MHRYIYSEKKFISIEVALDVFLSNRENEGKALFDENIQIDSYCIRLIKKDINDIQDHNNDYYIGINMKKIHSCSVSRAFCNFCDDITDITRVFFFGLTPNTGLTKKLMEDLRLGENNFCSECGALCFEANDIISKGQLQDYLQCAKREFYKSIFSKLLIENNPPLMLSSSNIYASHYISMKSLFLHPKELGVVIFELADMLNDSKLDYDALVCTSKNGAMIATLVGQIIGKKVVYCINLGPRFFVSQATIDRCFRKHGKYIYISDFICIGTEAKVLQTLLSSKGAQLIAGFAISNYTSLTNKDLLNVGSPLSKIKSLASVNDLGLPYSVRVHMDEF